MPNFSRESWPRLADCKDSRARNPLHSGIADSRRSSKETHQMRVSTRNTSNVLTVTKGNPTDVNTKAIKTKQ